MVSHLPLVPVMDRIKQIVLTLKKKNRHKPKYIYFVYIFTSQDFNIEHSTWNTFQTVVSEYKVLLTKQD